MDTRSLPRPDVVKAVCQASQYLVRMSQPSTPLAQARPRGVEMQALLPSASASTVNDGA